MPLHADLPSESPHDHDEKKRWFREMRGWIMVVAILIASLTYASGLNPPGGFWQEDSDGHKAGTPILRDTFPKQYHYFYKANTLALICSCAIIGLLMIKDFYCSKVKVYALYIALFGVMTAMLGAYGIGRPRLNDDFSIDKYTVYLYVALAIFMMYLLSGFLIACCCSKCRK